MPGGDREEGFGLLLICYVSALSKKVASRWRHGGCVHRTQWRGRRAEASKQAHAGCGVWGGPEERSRGSGVFRYHGCGGDCGRVWLVCAVMRSRVMCVRSPEPAERERRCRWDMVREYATGTIGEG